MSRGTDAALRVSLRTSQGALSAGDSAARGDVTINVRGELGDGRAFFGTDTGRVFDSP